MYVSNSSSGSGCGCQGLGCAPCSGLGLFDSPFNLGSYTWQEWAVIGAGAFVLFSLLSTGKRAAGYVAGTGDRLRRAKVARLRSQLRKLEAAR